MEKRFTWQYNAEGLNATQQKLQSLLLSNESITKELENLDEAERTEFNNMLTDAIDELNKEHTRLMVLMGQLSRMPAKQLEWENNHIKITKAIVSALSRTDRTPNQMYLARVTGLSRQTIRAHVARGDDYSVYAEHMRQYAMMAPQVMDAVLHGAILERDMKAVKLYFEILDKLKAQGPTAIYNTTNNYIQINTTIIKQEVINLLAPEQLRQIEDLINKLLPHGTNNPFGPEAAFVQLPPE